MVADARESIVELTEELAGYRVAVEFEALKRDLPADAPAELAAILKAFKVKDTRVIPEKTGLLNVAKRSVFVADKAGNVEPNKGAAMMVFSDLGFGAGVAASRGFAHPGIVGSSNEASESNASNSSFGSPWSP